MKSLLRFGGAGIDDQLVSGAVESADHRPLLGLPRRLDPQIAPRLAQARAR